jgi:hypothetical protein
MRFFGTTISSAMIGACAAAICVPLILALFRRNQAYRYVGEPPENSNEHSDRYRKWDFIARLLTLGLASASAFLFWVLLCTIERERAVLLGSGEFVLTPIPVLFGIQALFGGLLFSAGPVRIVLSRVLGDEGYKQLLKYSDSRMGINSQRLWKHMVYLGVPIVVVSVLLTFQTYATVDSQGLTIHPYFAIYERHYGWADVTRIGLVKSFTAPNGTIRRDRPYYTLEMADGTQLDFHRTALEIPFADQRRLATFVAEHARRDIEVDDRYR